MEIFIKYFLIEKNIEQFQKSLIICFENFFFKAPRSDFFITKKIKQNLSEYKQNTPILQQLKELKNIYGIENCNHTSYSFYNRIFKYDFDVKIERLKEGIAMNKDVKMKKKGIERLEFLKKKYCDTQLPTKLNFELKKMLETEIKMSTILIEELYQRIGSNILIDRERIFILDFDNIMNKLENSLDKDQRIIYQNVYNDIAKKYLFNKKFITYNHLITDFFHKK